MARTLKSMVGVARDLAANRREAAIARKKYVVVSLRKDGTARTVMAQDWAQCGTETREQAQATRTRMEQLNPGKTFVILTRREAEGD